MPKKIPIGETGIEVEPLESLPFLATLPTELRGRHEADALMVPEFYMGVQNESVRTAVIQTRFGRVLKLGPDGLLYSRSPTGGRSFVTGDPHDLLLRPIDDPFTPKAPRYRWFSDPSDGVAYGFLTE